MKKFYIAFSIRNTNAFITATIETAEFVISRDDNSITIGGHNFKTMQSRRPNYNEETDGQKLCTNELLTTKGIPYRSAPMIVAFFNQLEKEGWTVDKTAFVKKHWK